MEKFAFAAIYKKLDCDHLSTVHCEFIAMTGTGRKNSEATINTGVCVGCKNALDGDSMVCVLCKKAFHMKKECCGIANNVCKTIVSMDNISFTCDSCKGIDVHELLKRFVQMENELQSIREEMNSRLAMDMEMVVNRTLNEYVERQNKRNNLIIFGIDEASDEDGGEYGESEQERIDDIFHTLSVSKDSIVFKARLGKRGSKRRPLKVAFRSYEEKMSVLNNRDNLKRYNLINASRITVRHDKTRAQIEMDKKVFEEYAALKKEGKDVELRGGRVVEKVSL